MIQHRPTEVVYICLINGRDRRGVVYHICDFKRGLLPHSERVGHASECGTQTRDLTKLITGRACGCIAKPCWLLMFTVNAGL